MKKPIVKRILSGVSAFTMAASFMFPSGFTLGTAAADSYNVAVNVFEHDKETGSTIGYGAPCYVLVSLKDSKDATVAWNVQSVNLYNSAQTLSFTNFYAFGEDGSSTGTPLVYSELTNADYSKAEVNLYVDTLNSGEKTLYSDFLDADGNRKEGISRDVPGFSFDRSTVNETKFGTDDALLVLYKNSSTYDISVTLEDDVTEADNLYVVADVKHDNPQNTYHAEKVAGEAGDTLVFHVQTEEEDGAWFKGDGSPIDEHISGNEVGFTGYLIQGKDGETVPDMIKRTDDLKSRFIPQEDGTVFKLTDHGKTSTTADGNTTVVSNFTLTKINAVAQANFKSILGKAVNFGIVANSYNQQGHAETNMAANYFQSHNALEPDLMGEGNYCGDFYAANFIDFGFEGTQLWEGSVDPTDKTKYSLDSHMEGEKKVYTPVPDGPTNAGKIQIGNCLGSTTKLFVDSEGRLEAYQDKDYVKIQIMKPEDITNNVVNPMINHIKNQSEMLKQQPSNYDLNPGSDGVMILDTRSYPANATIYVDADKYTSAISNASKLQMKVNKGQTIVMNFDETSNITLDKFDISFYENGEEVLKTDSSPKTGAAGRDLELVTKTVIWNLNSVKYAEIIKTGGTFINPNEDSIMEVPQTSSGWLATAGYFSNIGSEWHAMYSEMESLKAEQSYTIDLNKIDSKQKDLEGAVLGLYPIREGVVSDAPSVTITSSGNNPDKMPVTPGRYMIKEVSSPTGYEKDDTTAFYIEVSENADKSVTISTYADDSFDPAITSKTYSPYAIGENAYTDSMGNTYTFKKVSNLSDPDPNSNVEIYVNGKKLTDEIEISNFSFVPIADSERTVITKGPEELTPARGGYLIEGTPFELTIEGGRVTKAEAIATSDFTITSAGGFNQNLNFNGKSGRITVTEFGGFGRPTTGTADIPPLGKVTVKYTSNYGSNTINSVSLNDLAPYQVKTIPDYVVMYGREELLAQIDLSSGLDSSFTFTNSYAFTINKVQENGTTPLSNATIALTKETYTVSEGTLNLNERTPIPSDGSEAVSVEGWNWDSTKSTFSFNERVLQRHFNTDGSTDTLNVFRLIETATPTGYNTPETDTIIAVIRITTGFGFWTTNTYSYYYTTVPHGAELTKALFDSDSEGGIAEGWTQIDTSTADGRTINIVNVKKELALTISKSALNSTVEDKEKQAVALNDGNKASFVLRAVGEEATLEGVILGDAREALTAEDTSVTFTGDQVVKGLKPGATYELEETVAPNGFTVVSKFTFTYNEDNTVTLTDAETTGTHVKTDTGSIVITDDISQIEIKKTFEGKDAPEGTTEGADMKLTFKKAAEDKTAGQTFAEGTANTMQPGDTFEWNTATDGNQMKFVGLLDGTYELEETKAPATYKKAAAKTFEIKNGMIESDDDNVFVFENAKQKSIQISKTDVTGEEELEGAVLQLFDASGTQIGEDWTSQKENKWTVSLEPGTYTIKEITAPDGFDKIETDVTFTVNESNEITEVSDNASLSTDGVLLVKDAPSTITVNKQALVKDKDGNKSGEAIANTADGKENSVTFTLTGPADKSLIGSTIGGTTIAADTANYDADNNSYTFTGNSTDMTRLKSGTYTLHEETAPNGYKVVSDMTFTIADGVIDKDSVKFTTNGDYLLSTDGKVLTILDDVKKSIQINKTDITGEKELDGAKLELLDSTGKKIGEWTSETGKTWTVED
ncbi:MAG: hypothetical protein IKN55_13255, partial [Oscillospiraceae bacterium]|nr:hypothetical protein [Oscillospiraceae bacterium]